MSDKLNLPPNWVETQVQDVVESIDYGHTASAKATQAGPRFLRITDIQEGRVNWQTVPSCDLTAEELERYRLADGDLVFARTGATTGKSFLIRNCPEQAVFASYLIRLRASSVLNPEFLSYSFQTPDYWRQISQTATGTAQPGVNATKLNELRMVLAPEPEQERIVAALESYFTRLDDAVATLSRVERNLKRYRASVLKSAVEGRLVPTEAALAKQEGRDYEPASVLLARILTERRRRWTESGKKGKYEEPAPPDTTGLPELPEGWCWATLPQLGELNRGKSMHRPRNDPRLLEGPYPFIQTGDVRHSECFIEKYESTYSEFGLAQSRLWPLGTLCITIAANIAETGILKFSACFPDSIVGFLQTDSILTRYVEMFLRTARERLSQYAPATAQKNINLQVLSRVAVPLPPAAEQIRIVNEIDRRMSIARHIEGAIDSGSRRAGRLRQSILKWAFEGKLADQDPSDEPASVLLERIKAERDIPKSARKKSRT